MTAASFYWHDYETSGADPARDRPLQFAGVRTDLALQPIEAPQVFFCQPAPDVLPHPDACLLTGITPQRARREGLPEPAFAARVHDLLAQPGTCGVGWNSLRFDDEISRHLFYRNFFDPYAREWQHGNSRWDLIDLARMAYALRPAGMQWPLREDGAPSFKLEHLARANGCEPRQAHDALSDVESLLCLARKLKAAQPRLWDWYFGLRRKQQAGALLDCAHMTPLLHVSQRYPAARGCLAVVAPISVHPLQANKVIVADLTPDPAEWAHLPVDDLAERLFTARADLPADIARVPLKTVSINRAPALATLETLKGVDTARIGLDLDACLVHAVTLRASMGLAERVRALYARETHAEPTDAELALYRGFLPDADKPLLAAVRSAPAQDLAAYAARFRDARYRTLLQRYRARHHADTLDAAELHAWQDFRRQRLLGRSALGGLGLDAYFDLIAQRRVEPVRSGADLALLDQLEAWGRALAADIAPEHDDV
ncbi:exodeoxyribonuclease I [Metallibacterium scheffleri]